MFWPRGRHLIYSSTSLPNFSIIFPNFLHNILYGTWITPSLNCKHPLMCVHTSHRPYGYPPFTLCSWQRTHYNPWYNLRHLCRHYVRCWFPCGTRTIHALPSTTFNSSRRWIDIVFTKNGIHTLINVVIADLTQAILFPQSYGTQGFAAFDVVQIKERSYYNQHPIDQFLP